MAPSSAEPDVPGSRHGDDDRGDEHRLGEFVGPLGIWTFGLERVLRSILGARTQRQRGRSKQREGRDATPAMTTVGLHEVSLSQDW